MDFNRLLRIPCSIDWFPSVHSRPMMNFSPQNRFTHTKEIPSSYLIASHCITTALIYRSSNAVEGEEVAGKPYPNIEVPLFEKVSHRETKLFLFNIFLINS